MVDEMAQIPYTIRKSIDYTTAVPMLWGDVRHFAEDRTKKSALVTFVIAALGLILGMTDFKVLVNTIYPASGYAGVILILCAVYREIHGLHGMIREK